MSGNKSKLIAFNYFGGKFTYLDYLYKHFPSDFIHFIDLFGGSFVVSLNLKKKCIITANEINNDITNFFQVLRDKPNELINLLLLTPCSNEEYNRAWLKSSDNIENARRFYVRVRQSFFGLGAQRKNKGWHMAITKVNANRGETVSKWNNAVNKLYEVAEVLRNSLQITNDHYLDSIDRIDFDKAFFYADPPYPLRVRASKKDYKFEFSDTDHENLAEKLNNIKGMAMVSSYDSDMYNDLYKNWYKIQFPVKLNNIRSGKVQEVIWTNYNPIQNNLFSK